MEKRNFQVNLGGVLEVLSNHLYSEQRVFIREILQNCVDAITLRAQLQPGSPPGRIELEVVGDEVRQLIVTDNGAGLTEEEVHEFLSTIGSSSKREHLDQARGSFIGQFGIGMLSCFLVSREVVVVTRSVKGTAAVEWRGRLDGSYTVRRLEGDYPPGTQLFLKVASEHRGHLEVASLVSAVRHYADLLPVSVVLRTDGRTMQLNRAEAPWSRSYLSRKEEREALLLYGQEEFNEEFLDALPLRNGEEGTFGVAFVTKRQATSAGPGHRVYLKGMLLSDDTKEVAPPWAFFVRCVVNTTKLRPTASREAIYRDSNLSAIRTQVGGALKSYLARVAKNEPELWEQLLSLHHSTLSSLAATDDELFDLVIDLLPFETTEGVLPLGEFERRAGRIRYSDDVEVFRQLKSVARSQGVLVINAGYHNSRRLLDRLSDRMPQRLMERVDLFTFLERFREPEANEAAACRRFAEIATRVLEDFECGVTVKSFEPQSTSVLYARNQEVAALNELMATREHASLALRGLFDRLSEGLRDDARNQVCFNQKNPLVRRLLGLQDIGLVGPVVRVLFVQSLMSAGEPVQTRHLRALEGSMGELIDASLAGGRHE